MADELEETAESLCEADDLDEGGEGRGCAWLAPYVAAVLVLLAVVFFIIQNAEPVEVAILPMWSRKVRPPTLVLAGMALGSALTILIPWLRHRVRLQTRESE